MKLPRRQFLHLAAGAAALPVVPRFARAQAYPSRPVRIIVPFAAGGAFDIMARLIGQWLSERLGQPFVIENRPGAGTNIGTETVVKAPPDGYTLLLAGTPNAINATVYDKLNFNFIRDIAPVASVVRLPLIMLVHPSVPVKTVPEFIAYAKANPGKISMASTGIGSTTHMSGELFKMMAGVDMVHVPYRGGTAVVADLIGGQVQVLFVGTETIEHVRSGKLRALAVTTATRINLLPDIPTVGEFLPGFETTPGSGSAHQRPRLPTSSRSSIMRSTRHSPIPRSRRGSPTWAARFFPARPRPSASSSLRKPRSGATSSGPSTSRRSDPRAPAAYSITPVPRNRGRRLSPRCLGTWVQNAAPARTSLGRQGAPFSVCTRCRWGGHTENPIHGAI
jgi:tripartite-type tricarboxylate transporter receptor subunit TctC